MKQKDIALIVVIVVVSSLASFFLSNMLISSPNNRQEQVEVVEPITADFEKPDDTYFNANAINPTRLIQIGDSANPTPFNSAQ